MSRNKEDIEVVTICINWNHTLSVVICNNVTYFIDKDYMIYDRNPIVRPDSIVDDKGEIEILLIEIDKYIENLKNVVLSPTQNLYMQLKERYQE